MGARLLALLKYSGLLFVLSSIVGLLCGLFLGSPTGIFVSLPIILVLTLWISFKGAQALQKLSIKGKNSPAAFNGMVIVMFASFFSGILNYFLSGNFNIGPGLLGLVAGALGGYWVDRQTSGTKIFGL